MCNEFEVYRNEPEGIEHDKLVLITGPVDLRKIGHTSEGMDDSGDGIYSDDLHVIHKATGKVFTVYSRRGVWRLRPVGHDDFKLADDLIAAIRA